jgi:hypothetical protein
LDAVPPTPVLARPAVVSVYVKVVDGVVGVGDVMVQGPL